MTRVKSFSLISAAIIVILVSSSPLLADPPTPSRAPLVPQIPGEMPAGLGFVPTQLDLSHLTGKVLPFRSMAVQTPAQWDWRILGKVTPPKDQSICGACYSFASLGCFESRVLIDASETFDFSENHAKECNWGQTACDGGNFFDMANLFSQTGTVLESCDPYVAADVTCGGTCPYIKTLLDWRIISSDNVPSTAVLKDYIYNNGPVYTSMYAGDGFDPAWQSELGSYDGSYTLHYTGTYPTNHAVLIVGWDDNLAHAGGTGAWIVKNSWGSSWGGACGYGTDEGYFTIAYGSASTGKWSSYVYDWQTYDENDNLLYYDEGGSSSYWGFGSTIGWAMSKFIVPETHYLTRVDFWTNDITTDIDILVYDDFNGSSLSNMITSKLDLSFTEAGYHSVAFDSPPQIGAGEDIYIVVKFANATYQFPLVADRDGPAESSTTYISSNGTSWMDLGVSQGDDVAIRVRTSLSLASSVDETGSPTALTYGLLQNYPNPFNPSTTISYTLESRSQVSIDIYNFLGQKINTIINEEKPAGRHSISWNGDTFDGKPVATGIYFYKIMADNFTETRKMLLLK